MSQTTVITLTVSHPTSTEGLEEFLQEELTTVGFTVSDISGTPVETREPRTPIRTRVSRRAKSTAATAALAAHVAVETIKPDPRPTKVKNLTVEEFHTLLQSQGLPTHA